MRNYLHQHIATVLEQAQHATLVTSGPAGLQAQVVPCVANGIQLYMLLPRTSDQLLNLEYDPAVIVTTAKWQVWGHARVNTIARCPAVATLLAIPEATWSVVVEVQPTRVAIAQATGWGAAETIDLE